ncbi:hypothetical protein OFO01_07700 [Campylobacter sp. JMF_01 NE2]|uniref:hypothetical protein n=1 Tax=unclassified Campylobacter TaxID=2593542 RepID=UPI0022E9F00B|nr:MULTISPECIES: hypothetical protein [unclassified Campylobacter]MDA3053313.1 hypothetical protein [Campylobacter sp. JMF_03 NE3]MDA3067667.1 hypothetical protein [Campylobacter sp. JMF_01 NE2]
MRNEVKELQNKVIKICEELNLNAITLAKMIDFDDIELVAGVLDKKAVPTLTMLDKMVTHLGINPVWLFNMPFCIAFTKFGNSHLCMFKSKPFTSVYPKGESTLFDYCKDINAKHAMLVFENFEETDNPRVAVILERDFVYEIISVFDFFDTDDTATKIGLTDISSIIDFTALRAKINLMVNTLSIAKFNDMLSCNYHIGKLFIALNTLRYDDLTADRVVRLAFEYDENKARELEKSWNLKSELLGKIDFVRSFVKSSSN